MSLAESDPTLEEVDLERLPAPPRTMRTVTVVVMAVTAVVAGWLAWSIAPEAGYAARAPAAREVGVLPQADLVALEGEFVRGYVALEGMPAASYRRPFEQGSYRVAQAAPAEGGQRVWVVFQVPPGHEGPRFVPPKLVAGRLSRVARLGVRFSGVAKVVDDLGGQSGSDHVIVDGETPSAAGWLLGLELLLLGFVAFNLVSIIKLVKPIRPAD